MKLIYLLLLTTFKANIDPAAVIQPFAFKENYLAPGENELFVTTGGHSYFGCGSGCLRCEAQLSGTNMPYTGVTLMDATVKRQCQVCDYLNGWGLVEGGHCVKFKGDNCYFPVNHYSFGMFPFGTKEVETIPCQICQENNLVNYEGQCKKMDDLLKVDNCKMHHI